MSAVCTLLFLLSALSAEVSFSVDAKVMEYESSGGELTGKDVTITFKDGSKLMGREAFLHFDKRVGSMRSGSEDDPVVFSGIISREGETPRHVVVKASEMGVEFIPTEGEKELLSVTAMGSVQIFVDDEYVAYGSRSSFQNRVAKGRQPSLPGTGIIALEGKKCRIEKLNGDLVMAEKVEFNPFEHRLEGWNVEAKLGVLSLDADHMEWEQEKGILRFSENIAVAHPAAGKLTCGGILLLTQGGKETLGGIAKVIAVGPLNAERVDQKIKLMSYGEVVVDQEAGTMVIKSPTEDGGKPIFPTQAYFDDKMGRIYADQFDIEYEVVKGEIVPTRVDIKGHVRMLSRQIPNEKIRKQVEQYAIADHIHYLPPTGEMELRGEDGRRVLFFDKLQGLELSAPKIAVVRGPDQEVEFHGKGNVRLKFTPEDAEVLKLYFPTLPF